MGLFPYLLVSIIQLIFVVLDFLMILILIKVVSDRWRFSWLEPFASVAEPPVKAMTNRLGAWLQKKTGKHYTERACMVVLILGLTVLRLVLSAPV